jgi:hypothetical protein
MKMMRRMGPISSLLGMIPGMGQQLKGLQVDDKELDRVEAIILSMTPKERRRPDIIKASRRRRIALGSGTSTAEVNRLLKQFVEMQKMMKMLSGGKMPRLGGGLGAVFGGVVVRHAGDNAHHDAPLPGPLAVNPASCPEMAACLDPKRRGSPIARSQRRCGRLPTVGKSWRRAATFSPLSFPSLGIAPAPDVPRPTPRAGRPMPGTSGCWNHFSHTRSLAPPSTGAVR